MFEKLRFVFFEFPLFDTSVRNYQQTAYPRKREKHRAFGIEVLLHLFFVET